MYVPNCPNCPPNNSQTYYAKFDTNDINKNIYGDKKSDKHGWKAKINVGAEGNIFELVENSIYTGKAQEKGNKKSVAHHGVNTWDYFIKTVQIDNRAYDVLVNIRKKQNGEYVYGIQLNENNKIRVTPPIGNKNSLKSGVHHSLNSIPQIVPTVNTNSMQNSKNNAQTSSADIIQYAENNEKGNEKNYSVSDLKVGDNEEDVAREIIDTFGFYLIKVLWACYLV